jgi:hypothetical protein
MMHARCQKMADGTDGTRGTDGSAKCTFFLCHFVAYLGVVRVSSSNPAMKLKTRILIALVLISGVVMAAWRTSHPLPFWRYQSLTVPNASAADLEQSMRSALGTDHAEFTYLGPHQLGITSFGASERLAMNLSGRLENFAHTDLTQRGLGPVTSTPDDSSGYSDGDSDDFPIFSRVHYALRNLGFPGLHFDEYEWHFTNRPDP